MKIIKYILIILLIANPCLAAIYSINDFSGGLSSTLSPYLIKSNECITAENVSFSEEVGSVSKRASMTLSGTTGYIIKGLHRYYQSDGTKQLLHNGSTFLKYGTSSFTTLKNGLTSGLRGAYLTYKGIVIFMNGTDNAQKWDGKTTTTANTDGARTANLLTADLGAPFAELNTGTNLDASSWYQYKMAFYDGSTYDYITARSNPILTGAAVYNITLTGIPIGPAGTTHRYIYRTLGGADQSTVEADTTFYLVATIADNTTLTVNDAMPDDTADNDSAPTWATVEAGSNATPPVGKYCTIHDERLFVAGTSDASDLNWSDQFNPDFFDLADYIEVLPDNNDEITFINNELGNLVIGKENTLQKFYTDNNSIVSWYMSEVFSYIGCPAPYTVVNSPIGIIYLARSGIYRFTGFKSELLSAVVQDEIDDILGTNYDECVAIFHDNKYSLSHTSVSGTGSTNDKILIYNIITGSWSTNDKTIASYCIFNSGTDVGELYSGDSTATGNIYNHSAGTSEATISTAFERGWDNFGVEQRKWIDKIQVFYTGTAGSLVCTYTNDESDTADSFTINLATSATADTEDAYTGVGTNKIYTYYPIANEEDTETPIGEYWKIKFTEGAGTVWAVQKVKIRYEVVEDMD